MIKMGKLVLFLFLGLLLPDMVAFGLDTTRIERVQANVRQSDGKLAIGDKEVIGDFVTAGLRELLLVEEGVEMADLRLQIVRFADQTEQPSEYSFVYIKTVRTAVEPILRQVSGMQSSERKTAIELNLMILLGHLKSSELSECGLPMLSHDNAAVKYWAVKVVAGKSIARQLNSDITGDEELQSQIVSGLMLLMVEETPAVILNTITGFASVLKDGGGKELLKRICMLRTKAYENWTVTYELMDAALLNAVAGQVDVSDDKQPDREELLRMFSQLYSYVIQRYLLGGEVLDNISKRNLAGVMLGVEEKGLSKMMGSRQIEIKQALTRRNLKALRRSHGAILGTEKRGGLLAYKIKFDYGEGRIYPKTLKAPRGISN